ncbi:uncharacterized protein Z518_02493 [Rhinocladiella mackenziei CBS 650.93]|uniref:Signal recognition particle SEC65 subunit n=1 Tax=Rhinocladiella mackenziei CBS 650.93 TaxID=1442369 RepID=A0A0D2IPL8_9EURO|nr:uncharacterized protein Z518_02493 [Rhinocladiella mackenziei CBS 650.93]KIX07839.1 hypothetical protein Z518_02493 [Rhinocladiella mackenziei CBS 650.93]
MSHARVEELSDSDPDIDDPSNFLPQSDNQIIRPANQPSPSSVPQSIPPSRPEPPLFPRGPPPQSAQVTQQTREAIKKYQTIYPIYFDSTRTRAQGRRVSAELAIPNPLAFGLLEAARHVLQEVPVPMAFEPDKTHPKDWANPGRLRVQLFHPETHQPLHPKIKNKARLYTLIGQWLKDHPTAKDDPLKLKLPGLPIPEKFLEAEIPIPRGWKMGSILPVHSPAVSGGGVRDDFFKEAMEEIRQAQSQGQLPPGMGMPGGAGDGGGMPDMSALQGMMNSMGGMPGLAGMGSEPSGGGGKKKKDKKKS